MERRRGWRALVLEVPAAAEELVLGLVAERSTGAETSPAGPGRVRLRLILDAGATEEDAWHLGRRALAASALDEADSRLTVEWVADEPWVERYQSGLAPFTIGRRFIVCPDGRRPPPRVDTERRIPLLLVPGRAFGTGEHATTRLAVNALERRVAAGTVWLDLGCGSGILSLVAAHCGAVRVRAIDNDPEAVAVAEEVLRLNPTPAPVEARHGQASDEARGQWDGVVANVDGAYFAAAAGEVAALLRPGGWLLASGFVLDQEAEVRGALEAAGLVASERHQDGAWVLLEARRRA